MEKQTSEAWNFITPQLPVTDVRESQRWYRDMFGFKIAWVREDSFGAVYNGHTEIYFSHVDVPAPGVWVCVRVDDVDALFADYEARGVKIVSPIESKPWGMREFVVEDNNGHFFRIGCSDGPVVASDMPPTPDTP